jgi:hypothetical protein
VAVQLISATMDNRFVIDSFLEACHNAEFQGKWMTATTWAELVSLHYSLVPELSYDGNKLVQANGHSKWLVSLIETTGIVNEH